MPRISRTTVFWTVIAVGCTVPWLTGIGVKLYLDAHGRPTVDWSDFLDPIFFLLLVPISVYWASPFIVLAFFARRILATASLARHTRQMRFLFISFGLLGGVFGFWFGGLGAFAIVILALLVYGLRSQPFPILRSYQARLLFVFCGLVGGTIGAVQTFVFAWVALEGIIFGFFRFPFGCLTHMTGGLLIGYMAGKAVDRAQKHEAAVPTRPVAQFENELYLVVTNAIATTLGIFVGSIVLGFLTQTPGLGDDIFQFLRSSAGAVVVASGFVGGIVGFAVYLMRRLVRGKPRSGAQRTPVFRYLAACLPGLVVGLAPTIFGERVFLTVMANENFVLFYQGIRMTNSVAFSPDGTRIAADVEYSLYLWNAETRDQILGFEYGPRAWSTNNVLAFSPDGSRITVESRRRAIILDSETGERLVTLDPGTQDDDRWETVTGSAFSPDGNRVATRSSNGNAYLYDASDGRLLTVLRSTVEASRLDSTAFSADGRRIATGGIYYSKTVPTGFAAVFDAATGQQLFVTNGHTAPVASVSFSPDNTRLMTTDFNENVHLWDASNGDALLTLRQDCSSLFDAVYMPDGRRIVTACQDGTVHICETGSGQCALTLLRPFSGIQAINVHPDGIRILIASRTDSVEIWNTQSGERTWAVSIPESQ